MFQQILESLARALERRGIRYVVIGGQAALLYGEPRLTRDIDVTIDLGPEGLPEMISVAEELGWRVLTDSPSEFVRKRMVLPLLEASSGVRIDLVFSSSPYEKQAMDRVRRVLIGQAEVTFTSVEDMIISKIVSGRPRDLDDVRAVLLKNPDLDLKYIHRWLEELEVSLHEPFLERFEQLNNSLPH